MSIYSSHSDLFGIGDFVDEASLRVKRQIGRVVGNFPGCQVQFPQRSHSWPLYAPKPMDDVTERDNSEQGPTDRLATSRLVTYVLHISLLTINLWLSDSCLEYRHRLQQLKGNDTIRSSSGGRLQNHWATGLLDQWITGLMDYWTNGLINCWTNGLLEHWTDRLLDHMTTGLRDCWKAAYKGGSVLPCITQ